MKVLIVEDQKWPLKALLRVVNEALKCHFSDYSVTVAKYFKQAEAFVKEQIFDFILLDHRLPYDDPGNLEETDFDKFSDMLDDLGYSLISRIKEKNPKTIIIGTSSLGKEALAYGNPDCSISKLEVTPEILEKIFKA